MVWSRLWWAVLLLCAPSAQALVAPRSPGACAGVAVSAAGRGAAEARELSSLKRTTRNLAEVIEQAMAECNSRASRDSNFAHLTSEQLQRAHEMHLKLCEKAGLKETPRSRRGLR